MSKWIMVTAILVVFVRSPFGSYWSEWTCRVASASLQPAHKHTEESLRPYVELSQRLDPYSEKMPPTKPGDWLSENVEIPQPFSRFAAAHKSPIPENGTIYVVPLGQFSSAQNRLLDEVQQFIGPFFGRNVVRLEGPRELQLPAHARRRLRRDKTEQWLAPYLMDEYLKPIIPKDAVCVIGFTTTDLWAGQGNHFLFGLADPSQNLGVWSLARNGDCDAGEVQYQLSLRRTTKIAVHEIGHLLGIEHCIAHRCCMNGANSLEESDSQPLEYCSECLAKVCWRCQLDPLQRATQLADCCESISLAPEAETWRRMAFRLKDTSKVSPDIHK